MAKKRKPARRGKKTLETLTIEVRRPETLRWLVLLAILALTVLCVMIAAASFGQATLVTVVTVALTLAMLWYGRALFFADASRVIFDGETVADDTGFVLCRIEDIAKVERGMALFRPSSGFLITLKEEQPRAWSPALWWRYGKLIGVGGATPIKSGRAMADAITQVLVMRQDQ